MNLYTYTLPVLHSACATLCLCYTLPVSTRIYLASGWDEAEFVLVHHEWLVPRRLGSLIHLIRTIITNVSQIRK